MYQDFGLITMSVIYGRSQYLFPEGRETAEELKRNSITSFARKPHVNFVTKQNNVPSEISCNEASQHTVPAVSCGCDEFVMNRAARPLVMSQLRDEMHFAVQTLVVTSSCPAKGHSQPPKLIFCSTCVLLLTTRVCF